MTMLIFGIKLFYIFKIKLNGCGVLHLWNLYFFGSPSHTPFLFASIASILWKTTLSRLLATDNAPSFHSPKPIHHKKKNTTIARSHEVLKTCAANKAKNTNSFLTYLLISELPLFLYTPFNTFPWTLTRSVRMKGCTCFKK